MASKQSEYLHEQSLQRLRALIPSGCPLLVYRDPSGFRAFTIDAHDELLGRFSRGRVRYPGIVDNP